jgi:hypothetical protein
VDDERGCTTSGLREAVARGRAEGWRDACSRFPYRRGTVVCAFMKICQTQPSTPSHPTCPHLTPAEPSPSSPVPPRAFSASTVRRGPRVMIVFHARYLHVGGWGVGAGGRGRCPQSLSFYSRFPMRAINHCESLHQDVARKRERYHLDEGETLRICDST